MSTASDRVNGSYRILVAFDNSSHAWRALEQAVSMAEQRDGELTLMTVVQEPRVVPGPYVVPLVGTEELVTEAEAELEQRRFRSPKGFR